MKQIPSSHELTRILFISYIGIILITILSCFTAHVWVQNTAQTVGIGLLAALFSASILAAITAKQIHRPIQRLRQELEGLHEQVSSSTSIATHAHNKNQALLESLPLGILIFNKKTELTEINSIAKKMLNLETEAEVAKIKTPISGKDALLKLSSLSSNGSLIDFTDWLHQAKTSKIQDSKIWPLMQLDTKENDEAYDVLAHYNKQDSHEYELIVVLIDRHQDFNRQEKQMEFISLAAHELRGPITVMRGLVDVFNLELKENLSPDHQELLTRMGVAGRQLAGYVDNILSVSRVDQDNFTVRLTEFDWAKLLQQATVDLAVRAQANHRKLALQIPKDLPSVAVDPMAIQHVINNLIDNAIKYSKADGQIIVSVAVKDSYIETTVQDSGIGMPSSVVEGLFTKFYRSHRSKQLVSGTGLGLYLCKAIVEAHGGNIWVRSTEGVGTTFGFTLPTYASVAQDIKKGNNGESGIVRGSHGWIKNHTLFRQ